MGKLDVWLSTPVSSRQTEEVYASASARPEITRPIAITVPASSQEPLAGDVPPLAFSALLRLISPERNRLIVAGVLAVASVVLSLTPFVLIYRLTLDLFAVRIEPGIIWTTAWVAAAAVVLRFLFFGGSLLVSHAAAFAFLYHLRVQLTQVLGSLPLGFFSNRTTGEIKKVLNEDVEQIELFIAHQIPDLVAAAALPLLTAGYLLTVDWRMTLAALAVFPFAMLAQTWMMRGTQKRW
jgi:ATP-binding cassette subfamily B protein